MIGAVIMVALATVLAGIALWSLVGIGEDLERQPSATFEFERVSDGSGPDRLRIVHAGGDPVAADELVVTASTTFESADTSATGTRMTWAELSGSTAPGDEVEAGSAVVVEMPSSSPSVDGEQFEVVWQSAETQTSSSLSTWPSAGG